VYDKYKNEIVHVHLIGELDGGGRGVAERIHIFKIRIVSIFLWNPSNLQFQRKILQNYLSSFKSVKKNNCQGYKKVSE